jgi:hypothetical protein
MTITAAYTKTGTDAMRVFAIHAVENGTGDAGSMCVKFHKTSRRVDGVANFSKKW